VDFFYQNGSLNTPFDQLDYALGKGDLDFGIFRRTKRSDAAVYAVTVRLLRLSKSQQSGFVIRSRLSLEYPLLQKEDLGCHRGDGSCVSHNTPQKME
jgi:hypothetical protein